jgi:sulfonate transport system permease protein
MTNIRSTPQQRPEFVQKTEVDTLGVIQKPLSMWEKLYNIGALRKFLLLVILALVWEVYAQNLGNALLFPTFSATVKAFWSNIADGILPSRTWLSIQILLEGYAAGLAIAAIFTGIASTTQLGTDFLELLTSMFNPLPSIALLPLALIWFGLGSGTLVFILIHSVLWSVALNTHTGFQSVSPTLRMVGSNYGLSGLPYIAKILIPAALPNILAGMKIGWAFAWRTLIAAELVFGASSGSGGLGWFIYENKNNLEIPSVFAGLFTVIIIGLAVEQLVFQNLTRITVQRWGMQS